MLQRKPQKRYNEKKRCTTLCRKTAFCVFCHCFALLCAVLPTRATGEEPALFRASLMYNDTTNAADSSVKVALMLVPQDENDDGYNAYQFVLHYDSERLGYGAISATGGDAPEIVEDSGGTLTIAGYGARRTGPSFVLTFNIKAVGDAQVTLTEAYVDRSVNALKDARAAEITTNTVTIHAGGCAVELPDVEGIRQLGGGQHDPVHRLRRPGGSVVGICNGAISSRDGGARREPRCTAPHDADPSRTAAGS